MADLLVKLLKEHERKRIELGDADYEVIVLVGNEIVTNTTSHELLIKLTDLAQAHINAKAIMPLIS